MRSLSDKFGPASCLVSCCNQMWFPRGLSRTPFGLSLSKPSYKQLSALGTTLSISTVNKQYP